MSSSVFPLCCLEIGSLRERNAHGVLARLAAQEVLGICLSLPASAGATDMRSQDQLLCGCWGLKPGPHYWQASALTTELSPHSHVFYFLSQLMMLFRRLPGDIAAKVLTRCDCLPSNFPTFRIPSMKKLLSFKNDQAPGVVTATKNREDSEGLEETTNLRHRRSQFVYWRDVKIFLL